MSRIIKLGDARGVCLPRFGDVDGGRGIPCPLKRSFLFERIEDSDVFTAARIVFFLIFGHDYCRMTFLVTLERDLLSAVVAYSWSAVSVHDQLWQPWTDFRGCVPS